jgi:hypothetical protein
LLIKKSKNPLFAAGTGQFLLATISGIRYIGKAGTMILKIRDR